jgi:hypothetical protein
MTSTAQTPVGQCAQPIVDEGNEPIARAFVACAPLPQETCDLRRSKCHPYLRVRMGLHHSGCAQPRQAK